MLLTILGLVLLVAATADRLQVSAAVGAFLLGIALSGEVADRARQLLGPLRDLFAATFFLFFSLQLDPSQLLVMGGPAIVLAVVTAATKIATGWWAARRLVPPRAAASVRRCAHRPRRVLDRRGRPRGRCRAQLGPLAAAYVLIMAVAGPLVTRSIDSWVVALHRRLATQRGLPRPEPEE